MGMRRALRGLQRTMEKTLGITSFELLDGQHYYFDSDSTAKKIMVFGVNAGGTPPEEWNVPQVYQMLPLARDPNNALDKLLENPSGERALFIPFSFDEEVLINERR